MSCTNTVATGISTTDYEHVLALGVHQVFFLDVDTSQHPILLCKHLKGEIHSLELASRNLKVACGRCSRGYHIGVISFGQFCDIYFLTEAELDTFFLKYFHTAVDNRLV